MNPFQSKFDDYGHFKDDTKRLLAMVSRDVGRVAIAIAGIVLYGQVPWPRVMQWFH